MFKPLAVLLLLSAPCAFAQTITATSCTSTAVQTAFSAATSSTTLIIIPTCTGASRGQWSSPVTFTVPSGSTVLTIQGSGSVTSTDALGNPTAYNDQTILEDDYATAQQVLTIITANSCTLMRVTGITFQGGTGVVKDPVIGIQGTCHEFRLDHNHVNMSVDAAGGSQEFRYTGWVYGVTDHNLCDDNQGISECFDVWHDAYGGGNFGDDSWSAVSGLGSLNQMVVEDNTFNQGLFIGDCLGGGRATWRYNTINQAEFQTHPLAGGGRNRGCRAQEVYHNVFNGNAACNGSSGFGNCLFNAYFLSSGTGLFYLNSIPVVNAGAGSGYEYMISAHSMRANANTYSQVATPNGWGYCGTNFDGTGSNWDGNTPTSTGYPCLDDPGRGVESNGPINGLNFPSTLNSITSTIAWTNQALEPVYEWLDGVGGTFTQVPMNPGGPLTIFDGVLTQNKDIYLWQSTGCSGTQSTGVCSGLLSSRASTCTQGVAFWATDTTTLYTCGTGSSWATYYTAAVYPHPLDTGGATVTPAPAKSMFAQINGQMRMNGDLK